jgi:mono/diheme cytochrome c family protein
MPPRLLALLCLLPWACAAASSSFEKTVEPFLKANCFLCHNAKLKVSGLNLEGYADAKAALKDREVWEKVVQKLRGGQMPPKGLPVPPPEQVAAVTGWFDLEFARLDRSMKPDPGRVTARRLNRVEYNNTIRDLVGVDFKPAADFPADDSGYGFDNIGDVLSLSPVLMEKYLAAAEKIARQAIVADPPPKPTRERIEHAPVPPEDSPARDLTARHPFPVEGEYLVRGMIAGRHEALLVTLWLDGKELKTFPVTTEDEAARAGEMRLHVTAGEHELKATLLHDDSRPDAEPDPDEAKAKDQKKKPGKDPYIDRFEINGPYNPHARPLTESHRRIFVCGLAPGQQDPECARRIVSALARRAYRRPVTEAEVDGLVRFVTMARQKGDSFEQGVRVALEAILVSPHFLFRIEHDSDANNPAVAHRVADFDLASRLSYFLWSSMPDEELFRLAGERKLRKPDVVAAEVRRMLLDPKSVALVDNFAGQWLELRNLDSVKPDPDRFPNFDENLRQAMKEETRLFFEAVIREDRSILDFIDGKFTFLNERLAKHYGIPGIAGPEFRRVELTGDERSGVLTQASVLTVSSYPTRTSPVLRGKWVLENFLNDPPPPPPPGVPNLDEAAIGKSASLRQQLEQHRANPACASCHTRMDPLGFGLENYDAVGHWRTQDGKFPVDSTGTLPGGHSFRSPAGLKEILKADRDAFARCLTEKMLTYALGRGLERYDRPNVNLICSRLAASDYRFSRLVLEIVRSLPFEMRRGEAPISAPPPAVAFAGGKP